VPRDPAPECALRRLGLIDHRDQLEVRLTERDDPVCRAPTWMTAASDRCEAIPCLELTRSRPQVSYRDHYVVELQASIVLASRSVDRRAHIRLAAQLQARLLIRYEGRANSRTLRCGELW